MSPARAVASDRYGYSTGNGMTHNPTIGLSVALCREQTYETTEGRTRSEIDRRKQ